MAGSLAIFIAMIVLFGAVGFKVDYYAKEYKKKAADVGPSAGAVSAEWTWAECAALSGSALHEVMS